MTLYIDNSILSVRPRAPTPCDPCDLHSCSRGSSLLVAGETSPTPSFCFGDVYSWLMYPCHALLHAGSGVHSCHYEAFACLSKKVNAIALSRGILRQYSTVFMLQRPYSKHYSNDLPSHINPITRINLATWLLIRIIKTPLTGELTIIHNPHSQSPKTAVQCKEHTQLQTTR